MSFVANQFIDMVETFTQLHSLLFRHRTVYSSLNLFDRMLTAMVNERGNIKVSPG